MRDTLISSVRVLSLAAASALVLGCSQADSPSGKQNHRAIPSGSFAANAPPQQPAELSVACFSFSDVARSVGIRFRHFSPLTEQRHVHLVMGSGVGWFDLDRDGWPDLLCCQGASFGGESHEPPSSNALFWNRGGATFSEVARQAGLLDARYSMGVASGDYDNDGFADLCVTGYQGNSVLHNNGDGTFSPAELPQQFSLGRLSASCAWADIDADGNLDLYITNYAKLDPDRYPICEHTAAGTTLHIACHPSNLDRMPDLLYRNGGDGHFDEISQAAGIVADEARQALGVIAADIDQDGDTDFYVANDTTPNYLWMNQGGGQFIDRGPDSGSSTNRHGAREASMGVAVGDVDGNGQLDIFVTNFYDETNTLYRNEGSCLFSDITDEFGLGPPSRLRLGFGASFADFDNDGWLDLLTANGHIHDRLHELGREGPFAQFAQVFHNERGMRFQDVSNVSGLYFQEARVGRGTAIADYDRDGDVDVAINHLNGDATLLRNETKSLGQWVRIELIGIASNRDGVGATLQIDLGDQMLVRTVQAGASYLSCDETTLLIGLGSLDKVREVKVVWPGGRRESWTELGANRSWHLVEGSGSNDR